MTIKRMTGFAAALMAALLLAFVLAPTNNDALAAESATRYQVTIQNLTGGQPLSPPVVVAHRPSHLMATGVRAIPELAAIAEDGNPAPLIELLDGAPGITDVVNVGMPLTPIGTAVGDFSDSATVEIMAYPGDRLSLASMLICTNDGLALLQQAQLPANGTAAFPVYGYDAGTEDNTELSGDLVDPCSALGPVTLAGDPNGNVNDAVDTQPQGTIQPHPGIRGDGDLLLAHGWQGPVAVVVVTPLD